MSTVRAIAAWEALDSRGRPTVAVRIELCDGSDGVALVPSGASAGSHEALELRDGGTRYGGRGVRRAVANVTSALATAVTGLAPDQVDGALAAADPSPGFQLLGANAVLAVSLATARAAARSEGVSLARHVAAQDRGQSNAVTGPLVLPMPMVNVLSGGAHAGAMLDVQDFLVVPVGAGSFAEAIEWSAAVRDSAREVGLRRGRPEAVLVADEGGLGLALASNRAAVELLTEAIETAGYSPGAQIAIAVDVAASEFHRDGAYRLASEDRTLSAEELVDEVAQWCTRFPVVSVEDILAEDDWVGWAAATAALGRRIELVGDDLFVTDPERLARGIAGDVANSVLVKANQNGLLSGAKQVVDVARAAGYRTVVSARSGETEDTWLADLAVGWRAGQIKVGSTHRGERTAKWNRLLELEATEHTTFAGPWIDGRPERNTT